jgi:multiple sugar transport system substrate-binding protein
VRGTDGAVRGFGQRGRGEWHTMYTGFATQLWSCGARDFDPDGRAAFADADAVAVTADFVEALRDAGPVDWTDQRWYELALDFGRGRYALLVDSDHYVAFFEDDRHSELVGRIGYALPPAGPGGERRPNLWTWSLAMTAASRDKRAARDFIAWAASKPFLLRSAGEGNMNPTRRSTWDDPGFRALTAPWGDFATVSRQLLDDYATVLVTPGPRYREIALRWTEALRQAYAGHDVGEALRAAAADAERLFAGSG